MSFPGLAAKIVVFLTPFLPYLILGGEEVVKELSKHFGKTAWEKAELLWSRIKSPSLDGVAKALAENPEDEDYQVTLTKLVDKQLQATPELALELAAVIDESTVIQKVLVERHSKVRDVLQRLSKPGIQETTIRESSQAGNITQEQ